MASRVPPVRRRSSAQRSQQDDDDTRSLLLSRTRSLEPAVSVAERVAVQEIGPDVDRPDEAPTTSWPHSVRYLLLLCAFLTSLSFGVTQVPLLYVFRLMTCDAYYKDHPSRGVDDQGSHLEVSTNSMFEYAVRASIHGLTSTHTLEENDSCSIRPIESSTAYSVSLLGATTTIFGTLNLFLTGSLIKSIGVKPTLILQIFFPALRLIVQNIGVEVWGNTGIIIVQCSQVLTIVGGPSGYLLALNTFITEVVDYEGRTAALGRLNGSMFFGSAIGFLVGGFAAESFGIKAPFRLTLVLFLCVCAYVFLFLPHIPPAGKNPDDSDTPTTKKGSMFHQFFAPLTVFAHRKFITKEGVIKKEYGAFLLAWGVYLGILATGYLVTLLQLYATNIFHFGTKENGALIFMYSMLRGFFLTFAFPKLISIGRKWTSQKQNPNPSPSGDDTPSEREPLLSTTPTPPNGSTSTPSSTTTLTSLTSPSPSSPANPTQPFAFDLTYTKFSLIADSLLTLLCTFVQTRWQMYFVAAILPLAAGTGSAAKGTVLSMVGSAASSDERTDALAGVSLVENIARLSTTSVFGVVFAMFASVGRTELVFVCNAAVALVGFTVLMGARFPEEGSRRFEEGKGVVGGEEEEES